MRWGRPPGLARAPCSRVRSWLDAVGADELVADADLDGVADDGDLDLAAPVLGADPVAGAGEAHVARRVDLAGHRRRGRCLGRRRQPAAALQPGGLLVEGVAAGVGGDRAHHDGGAARARRRRPPRRSGRPATRPALYLRGGEADRALGAHPPWSSPESRSPVGVGLDGLGGTRPGRGELEPFDGRHPPDRLVGPLVVVVRDPDVQLRLRVGRSRRRPCRRGTLVAASCANARPCRSWSATAAR